MNYTKNQYRNFNKEVADSINIIKGQNEILFLSNSIDYFVNSHSIKTGIDRGISYSLQYDIKSVILHIIKNPELRFPGYLLHQCRSLSDTIEKYNIFYDAMLNNGNVIKWTQEDANERINAKFGIDGSVGSIQSYIPYKYRLQCKRDKKKQSSLVKNGTSSIWNKLNPFEKDEEIDPANDALIILSKELTANESLEYAIANKLKSLPAKKLFIENPSKKY